MAKAGSVMTASYHRPPLRIGDLRAGASITGPCRRTQRGDLRSTAPPCAGFPTSAFVLFLRRSAGARALVQLRLEPPICSPRTPTTALRSTRYGGALDATFLGTFLDAVKWALGTAICLVDHHPVRLLARGQAQPALPGARPRPGARSRSRQTSSCARSARRIVLFPAGLPLGHPSSMELLHGGSTSSTRRPRSAGRRVRLYTRRMILRVRRDRSGRGQAAA